MPNARKMGKRKIAFWLTESEVKLIDDIAAELGLNRTDAFRDTLLKYIQAYIADKHDKQNKKGEH